MKTLKITLFLTLLISSNAFAQKTPIIQKTQLLYPLESKLFAVLAISKTMRQQTNIYEIKNELICSTESKPTYVMPKTAIKKIIMDQVEAFKKEAMATDIVTSCKSGDQMILELGKQYYRLCFDNKYSVQLRNTLALDCGRSSL